MPRAAKTSDLWQRFMAALSALPHPPKVDQGSIGKAVGVGQTMISAIKTGEKLPSMEVAMALADYAGMCVQYLLRGDGPQRPWSHVDPDFQQLIQRWEMLRPTARRKLLDRADELLELQNRRDGEPLNTAARPPAGRRLS